nr:alpha carbonic anhydrase 8-like [Aegilops tauschii subsp. strangulata]
MVTARHSRACAGVHHGAPRAPLLWPPRPTLAVASPAPSPLTPCARFAHRPPPARHWPRPDTSRALLPWRVLAAPAAALPPLCSPAPSAPLRVSLAASFRHRIAVRPRTGPARPRPHLQPAPPRSDPSPWPTPYWAATGTRPGAHCPLVPAPDRSLWATHTWGPPQ